MDHNFDTAELEEARVLNSFFSEYPSEEYAEAYIQRRQGLRNAFRNYRTASPEGQKYLKQLVELHTEQCRIYGSTESRRRHNTFILVYMANRKYTLKEIAKMQRITTRAVWKDLNHVFDDIMILAFGVDGIKPSGKDARTPSVSL